MSRNKKYSKISISLDEELFKDIETLVEMKRLTRSGLISNVLADEILKYRSEIKKYREEKEKEKETLDQKHFKLMMKEE